MQICISLNSDVMSFLYVTVGEEHPVALVREVRERLSAFKNMRDGETDERTHFNVRSPKM